MKYLKSYNKTFESIGHDQFFNTKEQIKKWLDSLYIKNYTINDDLSVDVNGDVDIVNKNLYDIPIQFGYIDGNFFCQNNELKSLKGCPKYIEDDFQFYHNNLYDLKYFPENYLDKVLKKEHYLYLHDFFKNPIYDLIILVENYKIPIFIKYLNDYNVIQGNKIILESLKEALYMSDITNFSFKKLNILKNYKIID